MPPYPANKAITRLITRITFHGCKSFPIMRYLQQRFILQELLCRGMPHARTE